MSKNEFLQALAAALSALSPQERDDIIADYRAYFDDAQADGRSEADVAAALGDPNRLAKELCAERSLKVWEANKTPQHLWSVLGALAGLGLLNMLLAMPYLILLTFLSSLWLGAMTMLLVGFLITGAWVGHSTFGWPALDRLTLNDSGIGPLLITGNAPQIQIRGDGDEQVSVQVNEQGKLIVEARDGEEQFKLEKDASGHIVALTAKNASGSVHLQGLGGASSISVLLVGLMILLLGAIGTVIGWKLLKACWHATGKWLRWQWQLINPARVAVGS